MSLISTGTPGSIDGPPDYARHNAGITAKFFVIREPIVGEKGEAVLDACGRPSESELEVCNLKIVGDALTEITCPAVDSTPMSPHIRFAEQYKAWKAGEELSIGTKLADWGDPAMNARLIRDLSFLNVDTIQDLASINDGNITRIIDGRLLRGKAQAWLAAHPKPEEESEIQQLKTQNEALMKRLELLEKGEEMRAKMAAVRARKTPNVG